MVSPAGVDPRAVLSPRARLAPGVRVGAYAIVGDDVELGEDCVVHPHAVVQGPARLGRDNVVHPFCSIGGDPQDLKYAGEPTTLEVGDRNVFRECVTVSRGTVQGGGVTRIGSDNLFMAYAHIAHDCVVGNHTIFANSATWRATSPWKTLLGWSFFPRAPVLPRRPLRLHWRLHGDHAGCAAVLAGGHRARERAASASTPLASSARASAQSASKLSSAPIACCCAQSSTPRKLSSRCAPRSTARPDVAELIAFIEVLRTRPDQVVATGMRRNT